MMARSPSLRGMVLSGTLNQIELSVARLSERAGPQRPSMQVSCARPSSDEDKVEGVC